MLSLIEFKPNKEVERKVNFFADYYLYANKYLGRYSHLRFETPYTLVVKIIFQLENNPDKWMGYIHNYMAHPYLDLKFLEDYLSIKNFSHYEAAKEWMTNYQNCKVKIDSANKNKLKKQLEEQLRDNYYANLPVIKAFAQELEEKQLEVLVNLLNNRLQCQHSLEESEHKQDLRFLACMINSDLKFSDLSEKGVSQLIHKLMSKRHQTFPLPSHIEEKRSQEDFLSIVENFFANRTFTEQFEGILNFKEKKNKGCYLYKVYGFILPEGKVFDYNGIKFHPADDLKFKLLRDDKRNSEFFLEENISIAVIEGNTRNSNQAKSLLEDLERILGYFNVKNQLNSYVDRSCYLVTEDFISCINSWSWDKSSSQLTELDFDSLQYDSPFFCQYTSEALISFQSKEKIYELAVTSKEVTLLWQYLEALIPLRDGKKQVKAICAKMLLLYYKKNIRRHYAEAIINLLIVLSKLPTHEDDISRTELNKMAWPEVNPKLIYETSAAFEEQYPMIKETRDAYKNAHKELKTEYNYYCQILEEFYELRNAYIHGGEVTSHANIKLSHIIPKYVKQIRFILMKEMEAQQELSFTELIKKLSKEADQLI
ncbi:hypothetical protein [Saprospira grandis]|uniref:hypothetical protein n=1 Tax=Saprospira grandis TaxID=1008 RepID=UPI0022DD776F|nr:hypothetical protein [Saprospira grandis]WBM74111.1 hypothetical protein OP864_14075 [Saprospira grandis]